MNSRSLIPIGLMALFLCGAPGCKKNEQPKPEAEATATAPAKTRLGARNNANGPAPRIDPQAMKDYRVDICYFGTLTLRQARDSYFASLGKDEPSEKKIPNFGLPQPPGATPAASAAAGKPGASGAPAAPAAPGAKASAAPAAGSAKLPTALPVRKEPGAVADASKSATPAAPATPERRPFDFNLRAPHERNARACSAAMALKDPPMGDVDAALAAFAPFASDLAKDITAANNYYQREEYKKDSFAKGKELHKKLVEEFQKLDELHDKLGNAVLAWRKDHHPDPSKQEEGEKLVYATFDDARDVLMGMIPRKVEGLQPKLDKLDKSISALKEFSASHPADTWSKIMIGPFDAFLKTAKEAKIGANGVEADNLLVTITSFSSVIEARQRAISRSLAPKLPAAPSAGLPPGHPVPTPEQQPQ